MTWILCSGKPEISDTTVRMTCGAWNVPHSVNSPFTLSNEATDWQVSSGEGCVRWSTSISLMVTSALANTASVASLSPMAHSKIWFGCLRGPCAPVILSLMSSRRIGASGSMDFNGSTIQGSAS